MKNFWSYYDNLQTSNPMLRFLIFMGMGMFFLIGVPLLVKQYVNVPLQLGQVIGLVLFGCVAWIRHISMGNSKKHRFLLICITAGTLFLLAAMLYIFKETH